MRKYVKPMMTSEEFFANEFVSACGEQLDHYEFKCDAGATYNDAGEIVEKTSGYLYTKNWEPSNCYGISNSFVACGEKHEADTKDVYIPGYFDVDDNHSNGNEIEVYIWQEVEYYGSYIGNVVVNHHATADVKSIVSQINRS